MKLSSSLATLSLGASLMTQPAHAAPDAATDPRIDPQVRAFLREINKDTSPFWELPQPKPQEILTGLQNTDASRHVGRDARPSRPSPRMASP